MRKVPMIILCVVVLAALAVAPVLLKKMRAGRKDSSATPIEQKVTPVSVSTVTPRDLEEVVEVTGTLQPLDQVNVGNRFAGRVAWIVGEEGTAVKRGDVVARMEDQDARTQVRAAQAALRAAEARAAQAQAALSQQQAATDAGIGSAQAAVDAAQARLDAAKAAVTQQATGTDAGIKSAEAAVQAAQARLEQAKAGAAQQVTATSTSINGAAAGVEAADARWKQAQFTADATEANATAQVKSAQAALDAAQSRLALVRKGARTQEQAVAENSVRQAKAAYDIDKLNYDRLKKLFDDKAIARSQLDTAETKMSISKAQWDSAQEQLSLVKEGARPEEIQTAEAAARQAEEGVATARANLKQIDVAKANVEIARTGLVQAKAALESARAGQQVDVMRDKDVLAAQAAVQQAQQALESARAGKQVNVMRDKDVLAALAGVQQARQQLANAVSARQVNVMRESDELAAKAGVEQAREALTLALQNLDDTMLYSPVDGVIAKRLAEVGQSLGASVAVVTISTNQSLYFEAGISELEATRIHGGQPVRVAVDALQGNRANLYGGTAVTTITGTVERVVPVVDARTRNFNVRVIVPARSALYPGMFARGQVIVASHPGVLAVPKDALVKKGDRFMVFTVREKKVRMQEVTIGASDGAYVQVLSGLIGNERIVVVGQQSLLDGDTIKIVPAQTRRP